MAHSQQLPHLKYLQLSILADASHEESPNHSFLAPFFKDI